MIILALGFVFGAWLLQQQAVLPALQGAWILVPSLAIFIKLDVIAHRFSLNLTVKSFIHKLLVGLMAGLFGFYWATTFATIRQSDNLTTDWQQKNIEIIGVVASLPEVTERGERFRFDVEKIVTAGVQVPKHISLNFYRDSKSATSENAPINKLNSLSHYFHAGERWQFTVRLKRPHSTYNPHGFDFEAWALAENIRATGAIRNKSGYQKLSEFVYKPRYIIEHWREKVGNTISNALLNKPYSGVIRALVVGDDSQIAKADWDIYLRTGINHLISISGLHITMLAGLTFSLVAFCLRRFPSLVMHIPTRKMATMMGVLVAILYASLAGWSVPTQRTIYMLITFAIALLIGRNIAISRVLAVALLVVVMFDPWAVNAPGFWLSFGAVALIAYVTVARLNIAHWFKAAVNTQWAITLGLLPLLIFMFGQASMISPIANAFAIPVISLAVVPLAILGSLLQLDFILHAAHFILELCMQSLHWLASFPTWQQAKPPIWTLLMAMAGVLWLLLPKGFPQRWLGLILLLPLLFVEHPKLANGEMQVAVLDVGQGLAVSIQTANHTLLYDAGPRYSTQSDAGSQIVVPFLRGQGIKKLDGMFVSHDDDDHSGGAYSVLAQMPASWLASSFESTEINATQKRMKCFKGQYWQWDGVKFEVLYPDIESYARESIKDNNRSCVLKVTSQFGRILLTGDIEKEAEKELLEYSLQTQGLSPQNIPDESGYSYVKPNIHEPSGDAIFSRAETQLKSDVLIAPHHGSKTSSTPEFIEAVAAKHIIFTTGYLNRFKHPNHMILNRYVESGGIIYQSDEQGALIVDFLADKAIQINAWRQSQPRYWQDNYTSKY